MHYLFVDNFRGFKRTFFPIRDVNFLVGENSTGKTSILGLIKLLSLSRFWFHNDFDTEEVQFGHFRDIVSINSADRSYFSIGAIQQNQKEKDEGIISAFLMTFKEREGLPRLARYTQSGDQKAISFKFGKKIVRHKLMDMPQTSRHGSFIKSVFGKWIDAHHKDEKGFVNMPTALPSIGRAPLMVIASIAEDLLRGKESSETTLSFRLPYFTHEIAWLAPIRTKPRRTYDEYRLDFSPEGTHTPYLIKKILDRKRDAAKFLRFVKKVGLASGLFESVSIKNYGRGSTSPFELDIVLNDKALSISNVGYGVSQSLPVIVELFARPIGTWFTIQQPEVHLHPRAQATLGDVFYELAVQENKKFIVETHSDFTIDRFRLNLKGRRSAQKLDAQVLFFERTQNGNQIYPLAIDDNGELPRQQPKGYRGFFIKEEMKLIAD